VSKAINLGYIFKISVGSVNGGFTEGNVITIKKITLPNGKSLPYISGQSLRRMMRLKLEEEGRELSDPHIKMAPGGENIIPPGDPEKYIDEDLFGYLNPQDERRRTAPVRVSAAVGIFPYKGDRDLGTRSFEKISGEMKGAMFETEVYYNFFRGNTLIELDRLGQFPHYELGEQEKEKSKELSKEENLKRLTDLLAGFKDLWGGGKQSRLLADLSPKFLIYTRQNRKVPIFLEALHMTPDEKLQLEPLREVLQDYDSVIEKTIVGLRTGIFANEPEITKQLEDFYADRKTKWGGLFPVGEAMDRIVQDLKTAL
jgi:CRISPR-associated protein Cst2